MKRYEVTMEVKSNFGGCKTVLTMTASSYDACWDLVNEMEGENAIITIK